MAENEGMRWCHKSNRPVRVIAKEDPNRHL
jgi:hypothetical protein